MIGVNGRWGRCYQYGDEAGGYGAKFSRFDVYGFVMAAGRACGRVCDWAGVRSLRRVSVGNAGRRYIASGLMMGRVEKGPGFHMLSRGLSCNRVPCNKLDESIDIL